MWDAQLTHAADVSTSIWTLQNQVLLPNNTHAVSLVAQNEMDLALLEQKLIEHTIPHVAIREPDLCNQLMAIGLVPCDRSLVKKILQKYPLSK